MGDISNLKVQLKNRSGNVNHKTRFYILFSRIKKNEQNKSLKLFNLPVGGRNSKSWQCHGASIQVLMQ